MNEDANVVVSLVGDVVESIVVLWVILFLLELQSGDGTSGE